MPTFFEGIEFEFTYAQPPAPGFCSVPGEAQYLGRSKHCSCEITNDTIHHCKGWCDEDIQCQGYSFHTTNSRCFLYTDAYCSSHDSCTKNNENGKGGNLVAVASSQESGCFSKIKGYFLNQVYEYSNYIDVGIL